MKENDRALTILTEVCRNKYPNLSEEIIIDCYNIAKEYIYEDARQKPIREFEKIIENYLSINQD